MSRPFLVSRRGSSANSDVLLSRTDLLFCTRVHELCPFFKLLSKQCFTEISYTLREKGVRITRIRRKEGIVLECSVSSVGSWVQELYKRKMAIKLDEELKEKAALCQTKVQISS